MSTIYLLIQDMTEYNTCGNAICYGTALYFVKNWSCIYIYIYMHFLLHQHAFRIKLPGNFDQKINFPTYQTKVFNATDEK